MRFYPDIWPIFSSALTTLWAAFSPGTMRVAPTVENPLVLPGGLGQIFAQL